MGLFRETQRLDQNPRNSYNHSSMGQENSCSTISTDLNCKDVTNYEETTSCKGATNEPDANSNTFGREDATQASEHSVSEVTNLPAGLATTRSITTLLQALRTFFSRTSSHQLMDETGCDNPTNEPTDSTESSGECILPPSLPSSISGEPSSGYGSVDASYEIDHSYIKVSKFSNNEDDNAMGVFGTYKEYKEQQQQQALATEIKTIIEGNHERSIKITDFLTLRTAADVMNLSKCEPYGIKGCKLIVIIQDGGEEVNLGSIYPEKGLICTFEITLVLHLKRNPCRRLPFFRCKQGSMEVLQQYELRKEKMYTNNKRRRSSPTYCR